MLRELAHFVRNAPAVVKEQKLHSKAEFAEWLTTRIDEQGYAEVRRDLVRGLYGRVLDVGCGTGGMFEYYGPDLSVEAIEPDPDFRAIAAAKADTQHPNIRVSDGDAMRLAFADASFDAVVLGLVLCSVPSVERVLAELHRVLRPHGKLRALEHVRSEERVSGFLMNVANPVWLKLNKQGCNMNRRPMSAIEAAGFEIEDLHEFQRFDTLLPAFPMQRIHAHRAG
jgi:ubiquinone/menaquinone biosynthesis C-methylase UbiE